MKKLIAYSSIAHMGFVTLGFFLAWSIVDSTGSEAGIAMGLSGGMFQMISHGFVSGALFLCVGRACMTAFTAGRSMLTAVWSTPCPNLLHSWCCLPWQMPGLPGTSGFVGEFLVILAAFKAGFWYAFLAGNYPRPRCRVYPLAGEAGDFRRRLRMRAWRGSLPTPPGGNCWSSRSLLPVFSALVSGQRRSPT